MSIFSSRYTYASKSCTILTGSFVGFVEGLVVGRKLGASVLGEIEGNKVGESVIGALVGLLVGFGVGVIDGFARKFKSLK